jgi:hypothetical protein
MEQLGHVRGPQSRRTLASDLQWQGRCENDRFQVRFSSKNSVKVSLSRCYGKGRHGTEMKSGQRPGGNALQPSSPLARLTHPPPATCSGQQANRLSSAVVRNTAAYWCPLARDWVNEVIIT